MSKHYINRKLFPEVCAFIIIVSSTKVYACDLLNKNKTPNEVFPPESMSTHIRDGLPLIRQVTSQFFDISSEVLVVSFLQLQMLDMLRVAV